LPQRSRTLPPALVRALAFASLLVAASTLSAASLQPSRAGLVRQSLGARDAGFSFLANDQEVHAAVRKGLLVAMRGNEDYHVHADMRHTAARPEVKVFVERLARQYRAACGERLVVTSLVRPRSRQPWNSDPLSVHPTGMALDLRISAASACRRWLEDALVDLESRGVVEAARERVVPHYHVVVFPTYAELLERNGIDLPATTGAVLVSSKASGIDDLAAALSVATPAGVLPAAATTLSASGTTAPAVHRTTSGRSTTVKKATAAKRSTKASKASTRRYKVRRGDNLWSIARRHGVTVQAIRRANRVPSTLRPGQLLAIPAR
jgi:LysM repeat protein